jgi:hypothetical protein
VRPCIPDHDGEDCQRDRNSKEEPSVLRISHNLPWRRVFACYELCGVEALDGTSVATLKASWMTHLRILQYMGDISMWW